MGKASRTKRERRDTPQKTGVVARNTKRQLPVFWIVVAVLVLGGLVAIVATRPDEADEAAVNAAKDAPVFADVAVDGEPLAEYDEGTDPAVGDAIPSIAGTSLDDEPMSIGGGSEPTVIVTVAHWCPHCQAEVPRIVDWAKGDGAAASEGVRIVGLSTSVTEGQPNFPPAEWLAREQWPFDTLVDDEAGSAASALGVKGFPFITFVRGDGTVSERYSGEMPIDEFADAVERIAP
ncbi:MAG: hypothetical protein JWO69_592 [Thermoleophilia bacterium]|nr:hypothetical protein [Thermoleophilia bacterium]